MIFAKATVIIQPPNGLFIYSFKELELTIKYNGKAGELIQLKNVSIIISYTGRNSDVVFLLS